MTFKRLLMPLLVVGIVCIMGSAAFAQPLINCGFSLPVGSTPRATATGHTEPVAAGPPVVDAFTPLPTVKVSPPTPGGGSIRVTCINGGTTGSATDPGVVALSINFGTPITNTITHPSATTGIRLLNCTGDFTGGATCAGGNVGINLVTNSSGTIVVGLGTPQATTTVTPVTGITFTGGATSSFDLVGVLASVNGKTGALVASLTSSGGIGVGPAATGPGTAVGPAAVAVIDSILPGLQDPSVPSTLPSLPFFQAGGACGAGPCAGGAAVLNSAGSPVKGNFVLRIQENYPDMFRETAQFNGPTAGGNFPNSPSADTLVQVILNNLPAGLNVSACSVTLTNAGGTATTSGAPAVDFTNVTSASPVLTISFNGFLDLDNVDVLWLVCGTVNAGTATLPLPSSPVTAQVQLAPTGAALSSLNAALTGLTTGQIPRYQAALQPATAVTVVIFPPSNTVLLVSFAFVGPGYNTGLAIANTTTDPFGVAGGGVTASSGTVTFLFVKNDGTTKSYTTTTGSPGGGLTGAGIVASGSTYVVNLSDLLAASAFGSTFTGYIFVTANFTNAHGAATIYTTSTGAAALSTPVLVMAPVSTAAVRSTFESLGQ